MVGGIVSGCIHPNFPFVRASFQCIVDIQPFDFRSPLHLGSSFLVKGHGKHSLDLRMEELSIFPLHAPQQLMNGHVLLDYVSYICGHSGYSPSESSSNYRPTS